MLCDKQVVTSFPSLQVVRTFSNGERQYLILNTYLTTHHYLSGVSPSFEKKIPQEGVNIKKKMLHLPNNAIGLKSGSSKEKQKNV